MDYIALLMIHVMEEELVLEAQVHAQVTPIHVVLNATKLEKLVIQPLEHHAVCFQLFFFSFFR